VIGRRPRSGVALGVWIVGRLVGVGLLALVLIGAVSLAIEGMEGLAASPVTALVIILLVVAVTALLASRLRGAVRPLQQLIGAARLVETGDYSARVAEGGPPPLRALARAFNRMSERLETDDRRRRSFLADVGHELRTPLTIIRGQLEAIEEGVYPADAGHLAPALEQTRVLEALVDDLRTLSLAESGALRLVREPVELVTLATETARAFRPSAERAGIELRLDVAQGLPAIAADPVRLRRVLSNLLTNAIAHTPRDGSVAISVTADGAYQRLEVTDTGSGIPAESLASVFERFVRGPRSAGSGLGLAIARDLVEAHGGTIEAISPPGRGATLRVRLPADRTG
jgi:signal transduction histidine kinase